MSYGWHKKLLKIDLSSGEIRKIEIQDKNLKLYLGGRGINI